MREDKKLTLTGPNTSKTFQNKRSGTQGCTHVVCINITDLVRGKNESNKEGNSTMVATIYSIGHKKG